MNDPIDPLTRQWICDIKTNAHKLLESAKELTDEIKDVAFDFNDVRGCFDEITEYYQKLEDLLTEEE